MNVMLTSIVPYFFYSRSISQIRECFHISLRDSTPQRHYTWKQCLWSKRQLKAKQLSLSRQSSIIKLVNETHSCKLQTKYNFSLCINSLISFNRISWLLSIGETRRYKKSNYRVYPGILLFHPKQSVIRSQKVFFFKPVAHFIHFTRVIILVGITLWNLKNKKIEHESLTSEWKMFEIVWNIGKEWKPKNSRNFFEAFHKFRLCIWYNIWAGCL